MFAKIPIKYKLTSIILIILVPILGYSVYHYFDIIERSKAQIKSHNLEIASNISKDLTVVIDGSFRILNTFAVHPAVQARDPEECDRLFAKLLPSYPDHLNILMADMHGYNRGSGVKTPGVRLLNYTDKPWFLTARKGTPVVGDLHLSKLFRAPAVMIAMPLVNNQGRRIGVIGLPLSLPGLSKKLLTTWNLPEKSNITVIDSQGNVLVDTYHEANIGTNISAESIVQKALSANTGSTEDTCYDGIQRLHSFSSVPGLGWKVIVGVPTQQAYSHAYAMGGRYIVILLFVSLIALGLSLVLSMRITGNLSSLVHGLGENAATCPSR
jgi:hypothetical protein